MLKLIFRMTLTVAVCAVPIAGCGGSSASNGQGGDDAAPTISKSKFIEQADTICTKGRQQVEADFTAYLQKENIEEIGEAGESPAETKARQAEVIETLGIPSIHKQHEEIVALGLPKGDEALAEEYFEASEQAIEEAERDPVNFFNSAQKVFAEADKLAGELGFEVCGNRG